MTRVLGINLPPDGFTDEELRLTRALFEGSVESVYHKLPTSRMKAIVAMHFELGYDQELVASVFGVTQEQIALDIRYIRAILQGKSYTPHKKKKQVSIADLLNLCLLLQHA